MKGLIAEIKAVKNLLKRTDPPTLNHAEQTRVKRMLQRIATAHKISFENVLTILCSDSSPEYIAEELISKEQLHVKQQNSTS